ncbi:hypothetical protein CBE37_01770 [bacterium TMED277]|nr:hypothetical protein [Candidatus Pelagibacter sp.]OUX43946.1 MAG: hypothetical protein CBE37_01770 [bacterium TMED277]|tara:strand:- start:1037 stop:1303 length:267 start_codon:yes stop_codon:yes gene_type:complete
MKIFIYKILIFFFLLFILFQVTFGYAIRSYENKLKNTFSKDKIEYIREIIKVEIKDSINRERILSEEDANLLSDFFSKLSTEIKLNNK